MRSQEIFVHLHNCAGRKMAIHLLILPKKSKANPEGKIPLFLRVSFNGQRAEIALKRFIEPKLWDNRRQAVLGRNPESQSINDQIRAFKTAIYSHYSRLVEKSETISAKKLKDLFNGVEREKKTIIQAFEFHNDKMEKQVGHDFAQGTYDRYRTCLKLLKEFLAKNYKTDDFNLEDLRLEFITEFDYFLRTERKCNNNTTVKYIKNLRKIINQARAFEWMQNDPFTNYKAKLEQVDREILTQNEIDALLAKSFQIKRLEYIKDIFLFSCFTGLAYADVKKLSKDNVFIGMDKNNWIQVNRTKTNVQSKIPVLPVAQAILDKYQNNPECVQGNKLLPVPSNQKYNAYLKEIADLVGINKELTTHIARHTFATTVTLNNKVPIETVSKMLGHRSIKTTEQYSKVLEVKISDDMSSLMDKYKKITPLKAVNE
ncbi:MAG: site-specific integrase [Sphingobacteriales bacterium]|nr:site-specific integrase [Sphingobacteriales bacterium]